MESGRSVVCFAMSSKWAFSAVGGQLYVIVYQAIMEKVGFPVRKDANAVNGRNGNPAPGSIAT